MSPPAPIAVRVAHPADAEAIARVHVASWRSAYRGIVDDAYLDALDVDARAAMWAERLADPAPVMHTLVAVSGSNLVGFVTAGPARDDDAGPGTGEVQAIYVAPGSWGGGTGRALFSAALEALAVAEPPFRRVLVWVLRDNERARHFYASAGLAPDGVTSTVPIGGADLPEVRYARDLAPASRC